MCSTEIHTGTAVDGVAVSNGEVDAVETDEGTRAGDHVVDAAGLRVLQLRCPEVPDIRAALADLILTGETDVFDVDHFRLGRFEDGDSVEDEVVNI